MRDFIFEAIDGVAGDGGILPRLPILVVVDSLFVRFSDMLFDWEHEYDEEGVSPEFAVAAGGAITAAATIVVETLALSRIIAPADALSLVSFTGVLRHFVL